jgi:dTDP-4-dehydrorhamnose reductase
MEKKRVVILGGSGYLGQHLLKYFSTKNVELLATFKSIKLERCESFSVLEFDLNDETSLKTILKFQPDVIINTVALSSMPLNEKDPELANSVNVPSLLLKLLIDYVKGNPKFRLIHISTDQGNIF